MPGFGYYIPNAAAVNRALIERIGLSHAFEHGTSPEFWSNIGPDGGRGSFAMHPKDGEFYRGNNNDIQWRKCIVQTTSGQQDCFYLGWPKSGLPKPADLLKPSCSTLPCWSIPSFPWSIPGQAALPRTMRLSDDGSEFVERVKPEFRKLSQTAYELFSMYCDGIEIMSELGKSKQCEICIDALSIFYRIGKWEADTLGILDEQSRKMILMGIMDLPDVSGADQGELECKKKQLCELCGGLD